ncbi:SigB/SigF/SigG family RNA polymerase sigma factor [Streptomyces sp. 7R007]
MSGGSLQGPTDTDAHPIVRRRSHPRRATTWNEAPGPRVRHHSARPSQRTMTPPHAHPRQPDDRIDAPELTSDGIDSLMRALGEQPPGPRRASLREQAIRLLLPLAGRVARRFRARGEDYDDLVQVACLGLVKAVDRYDPSRRHAFLSYALPTVVGELKRHLRDRTTSVRLPRPLQEAQGQIFQAVEELEQQLGGCSPTVEQIAAHTGLESHRVRTTLRAVRECHTRSLDAPTYDGEGPAVADLIGFEDEAVDFVVDTVALASAVKQLPERDRHVLYLRFYQEKTQQQIADAIGVSQMQVSRILARCLARLRTELWTDTAVGSGERRPTSGRPRTRDTNEPRRPPIPDRPPTRTAAKRKSAAAHRPSRQVPTHRPPSPSGMRRARAVHALSGLAHPLRNPAGQRPPAWPCTGSTRHRTACHILPLRPSLTTHRVGAARPPPHARRGWTPWSSSTTPSRCHARGASCRASPKKPTRRSPRGRIPGSGAGPESMTSHETPLAFSAQVTRTLTPRSRSPSRTRNPSVPPARRDDARPTCPAGDPSNLRSSPTPPPGVTVPCHRPALSPRGVPCVCCSSIPVP